jgi:hypothetical protein
MGYMIQGYRFRVFREIRIKVRVSSWTSVGIWILEVGLLEGFTRWGVWFRPPTPPTLPPKGGFSNFEIELPLVVSIPLVWDMEDMYGTSKGLR